MAWRIAVAVLLMVVALTIVQWSRPANSQAGTADAATADSAILSSASPEAANSQQIKPTAAQIEVRAMTAFNQEQYPLALGLFNELVPMLADQPDKLAMIQEDIRVCERNIALQAVPQPPATLANGALVDVANPTTAPAHLTVEPSPATRPAQLDADGSPRTAHKPPVQGEIRSMEIKELGNFEYDQEHGGNIPADVKALDGMTIRLHGFMVPLDQADRITQFALVPSLFSCCFGRPPQLQHTIEINCPPDKSVSYFPDEIVVQGTLSVKEEMNGDYIMSIFQVTATSIKPVGR